MQTLVEHGRRLEVAPFEALVRFSGDPASWLPYPATPSGDSWLAAVHAGPVTWIVRVGVGPTVHHPGGHTREIRWDPRPHPERHQGTPHLLPAMRGALTLEEGPEQVRLHYEGAYAVPSGIAGATLDTLGLHRLAGRTVDAFLDDVAQRLTGARRRRS